MAARTLDWTGSSEMYYRYWMLGMEAKLNAEPGNYILAREGAADWYDAIYVGHTEGAWPCSSGLSGSSTPSSPCPSPT